MTGDIELPATRTWHTDGSLRNILERNGFHLQKRFKVCDRANVCDLKEVISCHLYQGRTSGRVIFAHMHSSSDVMQGWVDFSSTFVIGQLWHL